jgi:8-oxo-dGTP pyrophosphatase MutT (NUDIX family)
LDIGHDLTRRLAGYAASDTVEKAQLDRLMAFLAGGSDAFSRANPIGHVTASALVVDPEGKTTLLTHHAKLGRWLQPGGHVDSDDETILAAALREAAEETGLVGLSSDSGEIFDVDVHRIPAHAGRNEPEHLHFDVRFLLLAPNRDIAISDESDDLRWFDLDEAIVVAGDDSLRRMLLKVQSRLA